MESESIGNWKRKSARVVYDNPWIRVREDEVINPNGGQGIYGVVQFKNLAIGIIPVDEHSHTWIVGQHRYPQNKYSWEIPEGGGPLGVDPIRSAERELAEEVGLSADEYQLILEMDLSNSVSDEVAYIFIARGLSEVERMPDETEDLEVRRIHLNDVFDMVDRGEITDAMSVAGLLKLRWMRDQGVL
ncbi:MAG: NUDIX hydrolase [Bacteroidota bacterium]|nr:NUDIX hydrolase [Bacteroidota bacterium]MDX5427200.1 NUDIX hydrolase [Bacteroidota bacterium]MDX5505162.1 NUDIX hydrolase [Bacteroidota bacterium]